MESFSFPISLWLCKIICMHIDITPGVSKTGLVYVYCHGVIIHSKHSISIVSQLDQ